MPGQKARQISVRIPIELDSWLERRAKQGKENKANVVRALVEDAMAKEREERLLATFNEAARDLTSVDRDERELITGSFVGSEGAEE